MNSKIKTIEIMKIHNEIIIGLSFGNIHWYVLAHFMHEKIYPELRYINNCTIMKE